MCKITSSQKTRFTSTAIIVVVLLALALPAYSQASPESGCVYAYSFYTDTEGWAAVDRPPWNGTSLSWQDKQTFGVWPFLSIEYGLLKMSASSIGSLPGAWKTEWLEPGRYRLRFMAAADRTWSLNKNVGTNIYVSNALGVRGTNIFSGTLNNTFSEFTTDYFDVSSPSSVSFLFEGGETSTNWYVSFVCVEMDATPTQTPMPGTPTATPVSATSTPLPTGTPYCQNSTPTPTPEIPEFSLTPTPTPTADQSNWSVIEQFEQYSLGGIWTRSGAGIIISQNNGRNTAAPGSAWIPNSNTQSSPQTALIYARPGGFNSPFYLDVWSQAGYLPSGRTETLKVWKTTDGSTWVLESQLNVSGGSWYPLHVQVNDSGVVAIAFSANDDITSTVGGLYLDDIYFYGNIVRAQNCDGTYADGSERGSGIGSIGSGGSGDGTNIIPWPADKPCPGNIVAPNNFWGGLLAQLTLFLDTTFAFMPAHIPESISNYFESLVSSPVLTFAVLSSVLLDFRICGGVWLMVAGLMLAQAAWSLWMFIKKSIPFLN